MDALLEYVQVCGSQIHRRIQEGKVPCAHQLDCFIAGIVSKLKDLSEGLPTKVYDNIACLWQPLWDFKTNCPGLEREKLDLEALLNICRCLREYLKGAATSVVSQSEPFDVAPLLAYVGECGSRINQRIKEGKVPSAQQLDGFISGTVVKFRELTKEAPADVTDMVVRPWAQFWDFAANVCGTHREKLDPAKLLEIFKCIREGLRGLQATPSATADKQEECKEEILRLVSGASMSIKADTDIGKAISVLEKQLGPNYQAQIVAGDISLMASDPRSIRQARVEADCEHLLVVTSKIDHRFRQLENMEMGSAMLMDPQGLEISFTYTCENSVLTVVEPYITQGMRWVAFEIGSDPRTKTHDSWIHIGVVPVADFEQWGTDGWTCLDDIPRWATEHAASSGRFIGLGSGCLIGSGYGIDSSCYDGTIIQPDERKIRFNGESMCEGPGFYSGCKQGDIIGVLVDCEQQSLRFFRNGKQWGPGYASGVVPPLAFAVDVFLKGIVRLLPDEPLPDSF